MPDSDLWYMAVHTRGMRRAAVALVLLLMMQTVAAAPPPGDAEVVNDICSTGMVEMESATTMILA